MSELPEISTDDTDDCIFNIISMGCELKAYLKDIIATVAAANIILKPPVFIFGGILHYDSFKLFLAFQEEMSFRAT